MKTVIQFFPFVFIMHSAIADAEVKSAAPDAKLWSESLSRDDLRSVKAPTNVVMLERFRRKKPKSIVTPVKFDSSVCEKKSYLTCVSPTNFSYAVVINKLPVPPSGDDIMTMSRSNALIYNSGKQVRFLGLGAKKSVVVAGIPKLLKSVDPTPVFDALFKTLGYDGIVLAKKDDFILVGTLEARLGRPDLQGLVVKNSADSFQVPQTTTKDGAALIALINNHGGYAVFKTVIEKNSDAIAVGSKIILEGSLVKDSTAPAPP